MSAKKTQVLLVSGAIILFVLLFIAPKITSQKKESEVPSVNKKESSTATLDVYLNLALKNMESEKKSTYDKLQASKKTDSLVAFWDRLKRPDLASFFVEELAKKIQGSLKSMLLLTLIEQRNWYSFQKLTRSPSFWD